MDCLCLLRGQDNDLSLVNGVGVHKTVGVALEDGLVLHQTGSYLSLDLAFKMAYAIKAPIIIPIKLQIKSSTSKLLPKNSCAISKQIGITIASNTSFLLFLISVTSGRKKAKRNKHRDIANQHCFSPTPQ